MQETRVNMLTVGARQWSGRLGLVLLVTCLLTLTAAGPALAQSGTLHRAVKAGDLDGVTRMLAAGVDVNARDNRGRTALMYAVDKGYVLLVEPLLKAQADPNIRAPDGATALFIAAARGHTAIIPLLMKAGADPTIKGPKGRTATEAAQILYRYPGEAGEIWEEGEPLAAFIALLKGQTWEQFEDVVFARALAKGTPEAYADYFLAFPQGRHADAARDAEAFALADSLWTVEAYADYIASYPSGGYVEKARRRQAALGSASLLTVTSPAGTTVRECAECPEMVVVPAGRFLMGDDGVSAKRPVHEVTIESPFAVGRYEVTFAEWDACVAGGGCTYRPDDQRWGRESHLVSWDDAQAYVRWLSRETGQPYRLLSEAEWEYVARARKHEEIPLGNDIGINKANCDGCGSQWDNKGTAPVGSFEANAFGLLDTAGNVWEWVEDCWNDDYNGAPTDGSAWTSGDCSLRVVRGRSWLDDPGDRHPAHLVRNDFVDFIDFIDDGGVRVALTLTP